MPPIRPATAADVPQIIELEQQCGTAAHWRPDQYQAIFAADQLHRIALVAGELGASPLQGFLIAASVAGDWEIENLVVHENCRRKGVGASLVHAFLLQLPVARPASVLLEVRESNSPARRLYEKIGFIVDGRRHAYYRSPPEDAVLYRLSLQICDKTP